MNAKPASQSFSALNKSAALLLQLLLATTLLLGASACDRGPSDRERMKNSGSAASPTASAVPTDNSNEPEDAMTVEVKLTTNMGDITLELDKEKAPNTVANFVEYVEAGHYDGLIFHRVIDNFMVQGGGYDSSYVQRSTRASIENEADNGLKNNDGTVAMARTNDPHSASSQFFINVKDNDFLNHSSKSPQGWGYAVFGKVTGGMDVVEKIKQLPTGSGGPFGSDVPREPVIIQSASVIK